MTILEKCEDTDDHADPIVSDKYIVNISDHTQSRDLYAEKRYGHLSANFIDTKYYEKVIESIFKRLHTLRVLAVALSKEHFAVKKPKFSVPESICQLKHLRYLAFKAEYPCILILPCALTKLQHIQLLNFGDGQILEFTFADLINLRHIIYRFFVIFRNIGRLISLQKLPHFTVRNEQGYEVKQLRDLNKLHGHLQIDGLENVKSKEEALEANLAAKERLTHASLRWDPHDTRCSPEVQTKVLEGLCPPVWLKSLYIFCYKGLRYPDWMVGKQNSGPKDLQDLKFWGCGQPGPGPELESFSRLRSLQLFFCSWDTLPGNVEHLTSLKKLVILGCLNIRWLPTLPRSLEEFRLDRCDDEFMKSCQTVGHPNWQKIEHIPKKTFTDLN